MSGSSIILHGDAADLRALFSEHGIDSPVQCVVTSPPYNTGQPYAGVVDDMPLGRYLDLVTEWAAEMAAVVDHGGRVWVNVPPTLPLGGDSDQGGRWSPMTTWWKALLSAGLRYRDTVVWYTNDADQATAWGSWMSPSAPNLRGRWEAVLLFFKGTWNRGLSHDLEADGVTAREFTEWTQNVWTFPPARRSGHPCPFPDELARRAVLLSTVPGETVLDPFAGSGTTIRVAHQLGRHGIGVDLSAVYVDAYAERGVQEVLA